MKLGILADTHINELNENFTNLIKDCFKDVELIIHAGDFTSSAVYEFLKSYRDFIGVFGNVDSPDIQNVLHEKEVVEASGYRIGIYHGHGNKGTSAGRAYHEFTEDKIDIIVFGHSHQPLIQTKNGILMINPGSLTNKRKEKRFSYVILELLPDKIEATVKFF